MNSFFSQVALVDAAAREGSRTAPRTPIPRGRGAGLLFHAKLDVGPLTLLDAEQLESAGLIAEVYLVVERPRWVEFLDVCLHPCPVTAIERFKPCVERPPRRRVRQCRLSGCAKGRKHRKCTNSPQHGRA